MKEQRKKIILNEILYWKANKVLPDHYCDYLLALYNQGEELENKLLKNQGTSAVLKRKEPFKAIFAYLLILFSISAMFILYFTELSIILQTAILSIFVVFLLVIGFKTFNDQIIRHLAFITVAFMLLVFSIQLWGLYASGNLILLYSLIGVQCFCWFLLGFFFRYYYFIIAGVLGGLVLVAAFVL